MKKFLAGLSLLFIMTLNVTGIVQTGIWDTIFFVIFAILAILLRNWLLFHSALLFLLLSLSGYIAPRFVYQFPALLLWYIFLLSILPLLPFRASRNTLRWLKWGKIDRGSLVWLVITSISATLALLLWAFWAEKSSMVTEMVTGLKIYSRWLIILIGIPLFSLLNALIEELIYRGLIQEMLAQMLNSPLLVIFLQATAFAALHYMSGFPNGAAGYLMVLVYGMMLGYLRHRSNGLLVPVLTHILADLTIFYYMVLKFL